MQVYLFFLCNFYKPPETPRLFSNSFLDSEEISLEFAGFKGFRSYNTRFYFIVTRRVDELQ